MTPQERKLKILEISKQTPVQTGTLLKYQGEIKPFDVFKIPLDFLVYNIENGRISSVVKSYQREHGALAPENSEDAARIASFLFESSKERNETTLRDIAENGQMEPGIITIDGVIVDGNRRASLLNRIRSDQSNKYTQSQKDRSAYFLARILPEDADAKEILRLETSFQMGADSKVDYNPIEKYLHARDLKDHDFSLAEIAQYMGLKSQNEVKTYLEILELMDEYLEQFDYDGIYTRLPRGCEDDFIKLNATLKKIKNGNISWIPSDRLLEVETDFKSVCFYFIRLEEKGDFDFRSIGYTSNNNFLMDEKSWDAFMENFNRVYEEEPEEASTEEVIAKARGTGDTNRVLNQRDNVWKDARREMMMDAFHDAKTSLENKKEKNKPVALLKKAISALSEISTDGLTGSSDKEDIKLKLSQIRELVSTLTTAVE